MAGERIKLDVQPRETGGSADARRLRAGGMIPGVLYGSGKAAHPFAVGERELRRVLTGEHGLHAILDVVFDGQKTAHHAVLKDYQLDPTRARLLHIDLHEVRLDQPIQAQVTVELIGESQGVKEGGVLTLVLREVNVEALPMEVPDRVELDISAMVIGDSLRVGDLPAIDGVTYLDDPENVVANVSAPRVEEEPEVVEEELEEGELPPEEVPEGEAAEPAEASAEADGGGKSDEG
ncbi:MAG: 50S ribosomal protein L25 [Gaiellaceae bacterium]